MGVGCGTHTGLIGEKSPGYAITDGFPHRDTCCAADHCGRIEGSYENHFERARKSGDVHANQNQASHDIDARHERHDSLYHSRQSGGAAYEDERRNHSQNDADGYRRDIDIPGFKDTGKGRADGIGLYHIAHKAQGQDDENGENHSQHPSEGSFKCLVDIVNRTSGHFSVFLGLIFLGQGCLAVDGSHSEECADPHPENSPRTSGDQRRGRAGQVAGTYLGRYRCGQRLERGHLALLPLSAG